MNGFTDYFLLPLKKIGSMVKLKDQERRIMMSLLQRVIVKRSIR